MESYLDRGRRGSQSFNLEVKDDETRRTTHPPPTPKINILPRCGGGGGSQRWGGAPKISTLMVYFHKSLVRI